MTGSFLGDPPASPQVQALYDEDLADDGYVSNVSRLWAQQPDTMKGLFDLMSGRPLAGPPRRPLSIVRLQIRGDDIFAAGVEERTV